MAFPLWVSGYCLVDTISCFSLLPSFLIPINYMIESFSSFFLFLILIKNLDNMNGVCVGVFKKITQFFFNRAVLNPFWFSLKFLSWVRLTCRNDACSVKSWERFWKHAPCESIDISSWTEYFASILVRIQTCIYCYSWWLEGMLIPVLCHAVNSCFELCIRTCNHITFSVNCTFM